MPQEYCKKPTHENCNHGTIEYDEHFHLDDQVRSLKFTDAFSIPQPDICYAIWKLLNDVIENREAGEKNTFYVRWGRQTYNVVEMNTLKDLGEELLRTKSDVIKETEFLRNGKNHKVPTGILQLDEQDVDIFLVSEKILKNKLTLKENIPLAAIDRTMTDYEDLDNEQIYNFSLPDRQFFEDDLHNVTEILNSQVEGKDKYFVYTPEIREDPVCEEYITNNGGKSAERIHVILNVAVSKGMVNLTEKNGHWVYSCIQDEGTIVYGDPLGSHGVPSNLLKVLTPIYRAKYGKDIVTTNIQIINCSNNVNFPIQTCSTICGLISAMLCICSFSDDLYKEIMFSKTENVQLKFIKRPSFFKVLYFIYFLLQIRF